MTDDPLSPGLWQTLQTITESLDSLDLDRTLLTIRNALVEKAGYDRAGILLVDEDDPETLHGTWGTAPDGTAQAEHGWRTRVDDHPNSSRVLRGEVPYVLRHSEVGHIPTPPGTPSDLNQHAIIPLKSGDRMLGVISVDNMFTQRPLTEKDVRFLLLVARHVAVALEKARSFERERRQAEEKSEAARRYARRLEGLESAAAEVASTLSLPEALEGILKAAGEVMESDRVAIWNPEEPDKWVCAAWRRLGEAYRDWSALTQTEALAGSTAFLDTLRAGRPILVPDVSTAPEWSGRREMTLREGIAGLIVYPLIIGSDLLGTLVFYGDRPHQFSEEDVTLGGLFAHHAAMAMHKARTYDALRQARDTLAERVRERTRQLEDAQEQLIRSERLAAIGQVSATIAHDLRGPLGVINNAAYLLSMRFKDADEKTHQVIDSLRNQVQSCSSIINDLLDYSRDIQPVRKPASWRRLVQSALTTLPPHPRVHIRNETVEDTTMEADPDLLIRAAANLILNATQTVGESGGGEVTIRSGSDDDHAWLEVWDSGPGVPEEIRDRIFEPFFTTRRKGTGLGLPLVKRIVEAHGGQVTVKTGDGSGACFTIRLPVSRG